MPELSLCMIVRNEEAVLGRCLDCIRDAVDEIVIVDTGSIDRTRDIAMAYTNDVYDFVWVDDFAKARNYAFSKATKPYIMWLDADDVILPESVLQLNALMDNLEPNTDMVMMPYHVAFDAQGKLTMTYERERIIRNGAGLFWVGAIHEVIPPAGKIVHADIPILHQKVGPGDPDRNLRIYEKMIASGQKLHGRDEYYYARELMYHQRFEEAVRGLEHFLDSGLGWIENVLSACRDLSECYKALGSKEKALAALYRSFHYGSPRAETCCQIGRHFYDKEDFQTAAFWYELAISGMLINPPGGFQEPDCYGYIPYMQLCVCYYRQGYLEKAIEYNRLAGEIKPDDPSYLYNRAFFQAQLQHA